MLWSRDDLMSYLLVRMSKRISDKVGQILACSRCAGGKASHGSADP